MAIINAHPACPGDLTVLRTRNNFSVRYAYTSFPHFANIAPSRSEISEFHELKNAEALLPPHCIGAITAMEIAIFAKMEADAGQPKTVAPEQYAISNPSRPKTVANGPNPGRPKTVAPDREMPAKNRRMEINGPEQKWQGGDGDDVLFLFLIALVIKSGGGNTTAKIDKCCKADTPKTITEEMIIMI